MQQSRLYRVEMGSPTVSNRFWYSVQAFLVAAGNISKLLWPPYRKGEKQLPERGPQLRAILKVEESSPLEPRTFRNHFEHFDMRLEEWAISSGPLVFIDGNIRPIQGINGAKPGDDFRNFDHINFAVTFQGDRYDLRPIVEAIQCLEHKATIQLQQRASA
jgi:hypothetical protein